MDKNLKCKICGGIFLTTVTTGLIVTNIIICEPCRKEIEENPDFHEGIRAATPFEGFVMSGITSTASVGVPSNYIDNIIINYNKF